ncbi:hypothetical protein HAX54_021749, partial [Datura stramonium]|nr:hypothetical protein [Datura stramonium]
MGFRSRLASGCSCRKYRGRMELSSAIALIMEFLSMSPATGGAFITAVILLWRSRYGGDLSDAASKSTWGHIYGNTFHHGLIVITADLIETLPDPISEQAGVCWEVRDCMLGCDVPFDPLGLKGVPGRGRKKRRADSDDKGNEALRCSGASPSRPTGPLERIETNMTAMREMLSGLPRPLMIS